MTDQSDSDRGDANSPRPIPGQLQLTQTEYYSGPLPDPNTLSQYDSLVEGGAERIFQQFEEQGRTRRKIDLRREWRAWLAQGSALIVAMTLIVGGFLLILNDKSLEGLAVILPSVASIVWAFRRSTGE